MIFVDTGAFLARFITRDQHYEQATRAWRKLEVEGSRIATSNFVLDELFTLLGQRTSYSFAAQRARGLLASRKLEILRPDAETELAALDLFEKLADQKVSFTDCISFVLMRQRRIERAFSFDRHFTAAGFTLWPGERI